MLSKQTYKGIILYLIYRLYYVFLTAQNRKIKTTDTIKMKKQLWKNVFDGILFRKTVSSEGLPLEVEFNDILRLIRLFLSVVAFEYATRIRKIQPKIRSEGF